MSFLLFICRLILLFWALFMLSIIRHTSILFGFSRKKARRENTAVHSGWFSRRDALLHSVFKERLHESARRTKGASTPISIICSLHHI